MAQEWTTPATADAPQPQPRTFELRPLSLGEILDRTFAVYRTRFWLFAGLAAIYGVVSSIAGGMQATVQHMIMTHMGQGVAQIEATASTALIILLALPVGAVVQAAILYALSEVYLGRAVSPGVSLRAVIGRWYRWIGVLIWQVWSAMWVALLVLAPGIGLLAFTGASDYAWVGGVLIFLAIVGGGAYGMYAFLRNSLALAAAAIENTTARASMRRSKVLSVGAKWRVFVVGLVVYALTMVAAILQMPLAILIAATPLDAHIAAHAVIIAVNFVATTVVTPVGTIGVALVYFDQRVRKEGFDLLVLMGTEAPATVTDGQQTYFSAGSAAQGYAEESGDPADPIGNDGRI
jgi:hypothetical protein